MKTITVTTSEAQYPGLHHSANHVSAFFQSGDGLFLLALKSRAVVRFYPDDTFDFLYWLRENKIRKVD
ncbi:hypothetical protein [uncultured Chitinophaga sp.]|uniref:hypothetical protein n=1 Tax=uncultured Chitinophaga sp. TaxID=339340 RepID=UPI0025FBE955|nr:hypothetical protein [uncultured Chitinophaga sp.]